MWRFAAAEPFTSRFDFREDDRRVERFERRGFRVAANRRFERLEPFALRGRAPPPSKRDQ